MKKIKKKKMEKFNKVIIFTLLICFCIFNNSIASDKKDCVRNNTIRSCEYKYEQGSSNLYYCILSQFYAFERVLDIIIRYKSQENANKINKLLQKYHNKKLDVFNFVKIERDFNYYLEEKKHRGGKNGYRME